MLKSIDEVDAFIKDQKFKDDSILVSTFKKVVLKYPQESLRQHAIRAAIAFFEVKYKIEYEIKYDDQIKKRREKAKNEYAADKDQDFRLSFSLPESLIARIARLLEELKQREMLPKDEPDFMSDRAIEQYEENKWFAKEFKRYLIPSKY